MPPSLRKLHHHDIAMIRNINKLDVLQAYERALALLCGLRKPGE